MATRRRIGESVDCLFFFLTPPPPLSIFGTSSTFRNFKIVKTIVFQGYISVHCITDLLFYYLLSCENIVSPSITNLLSVNLSVIPVHRFPRTKPILFIPNFIHTFHWVISTIPLTTVSLLTHSISDLTNCRYFSLEC